MTFNIKNFYQVPVVAASQDLHFIGFDARNNDCAVLMNQAAIIALLGYTPSSPTDLTSYFHKDGSDTLTILKLSATVNANNGIIKVGTLVLASTFGLHNSFFGGAGNLTMTGAGNTLIGNLAATALTTGADNVAVGYQALEDETTGASNVALGQNALNSQSEASGNIGIGSFAGQDITTGNNNVVIGVAADVLSATADAQLSVQNALYGTGNTGSGSTPSTGNLGAYVQAPTARFHLPAGSATAGTAPLKMTSGTVLGTPENGAIEFDGTHLYITISGARKTVTVT